MSGIEQIIEGLKIFAKYGGDVSAEHDVIYAGTRHQNILPEDQEQLKNLDWGFDSSVESWYKFV